MVKEHALIPTRTIVQPIQEVQHGMGGNVSVPQERMTMDIKTVFQQEIIVQIQHLVQHLVHPMGKRTHGTVFVATDITGQIRV
jgi:hypothetical protein